MPQVVSGSHFLGDVVAKDSDGDASSTPGGFLDGVDSALEDIQQYGLKHGVEKRPLVVGNGDPFF